MDCQWGEAEIWEHNKHNEASIQGVYYTNIHRTAWMEERRERWEVTVSVSLYLCLVLGLGPGVGRGVLTWLMSSMLARGARGVLAITILSLLDMLRPSPSDKPVNVNSQVWGEISTESGSWRMACVTRPAQLRDCSATALYTSWSGLYTALHCSYQLSLLANNNNNNLPSNVIITTLTLSLSLLVWRYYLSDCIYNYKHWQNKQMTLICSIDIYLQYNLHLATIHIRP